ncbi:NPCBM/NEW2 domain-containing protein [Streptomyces thermodiastaticus]|jgi:alpha-galactosidase|uniref:NPCBM/NEW2 domain-containing protein n=1 Tax=Streptomyces thermodiastaticus TaxID=44061 RepID=UPI00167348CE|nr:NPCBM/NEW2 domain-containing protein [Streptomyces thermodiastaticus]MCE7549517.1 NPCBM/NEW2 domain-containing protein [Streptomyces thermodiastaticus]GHF57539.1 alpha-galactosidase [Streptomyces thermodiastaticus]
MRHPSTRPRRRRLLGALTASLLALAGTAPAAVAADRHPPAADGGPSAAPALADGLALTPPMGFNNWNATHCGPEFDEAMVEGIADLFVTSGLKDAGYEYVNLDDCWALPSRDADGKLVPDPARFPHGIKAVADYVHAKGLKLGIYTSAGTKTCNSAGFPGALGHEYSDAEQFAEWGIDYLKYDNCNNQGVDAKQRYTTMRDALKAATAKTGRPIVYSICEWGENKPWEWAADVGHLWRTTGDISDSWASMLSILKKNLPLAPYAGPGHWNDPDMLEVGNGGMTDTEYRTHFSMWAVMAAPLLIGTDLRKATPETLDILGNREVIAVDQDPLGKQGTVVSSEGGRWVVAKEMRDGSRAVALFNESDTAQRIATTATAVGLPAAGGYTLRDLWQHRSSHTAGTIAATVPAHGTVLVRVRADRHWAGKPPAVELGVDGLPLVVAGDTTTLTSTATDLGRIPAREVAVSLTGPEGWTLRARTPDRAATVPPGRTVRTAWAVTPPKDAQPGPYDLTLTVRHRAPDGRTVSAALLLTVPVVVPPPTGTSYLSDLPWMSATSYYGPVERDTSNGERPAGDGHPITIGGTVYAKGLGVHAPSSVTYYTGGACTAVTAEVGVDDEKDTKGTVAFEIWADDTEAASTGVLTNAMPAQHLEADVTGAQVVRLVVTDGGDGTDSDHADWADARLTC